MRKKILIPAIIILTLLFSSIAETRLINNVRAWLPYEPSAESSITIDFSSPEENKLYNTENIILNFNVSVGENTQHTLISSISYETDWQKENTTIYSFDGYFLRNEVALHLLSPRKITLPRSKISQSVELADIPEGNHSIKMYVTAWQYSSIEKKLSVFEYYYNYTDLTMANRSGAVFFAVDTISPEIVFSSPKNMTYDSHDVSVNFTVDELFSKCSYSLDGQENVTITGNTTVPSVLDGKHNLTLFVTDVAGNIGSSETLYFTVKVPKPPVVPVLVIMAVVVGACLLIHFKKRKH